VHALFVIANPMPIKYAMNISGFNVGNPRPPLYEPDEKTAALIRETLKDYRIDLPV
jgi:4-hydroxy-tetrahydrodipicolinate synthase